MEEVKLDFPLIPHQPDARARVVHWWPEDDKPKIGKPEDIAILELTTEVPSGATPATLLALNSFFNHSVYVCGFPEGMPNGDWVNGELQDMTGKGRVQLDHELGGRTVVEGFSGTPVFDKTKNLVLGIIVSKAARGGTISAYMIPVSTVGDAWPDLKAMIRYHDPGVEDYLERVGNMVNQWRDEINKNDTYPIQYRVLPVTSIEAADDLLRKPLFADYKEYEGEGPCLNAQEWVARIAARDKKQIHLLQARGGAGKSNFIFDVVDACVGKHIVPFVIRARDLDRKNDNILKGFQSETLQERVAHLSNLVFRPGKIFSNAISNENNHRSLLIIDGLNEYPKAATLLLSAARELTDSCRWFSVLATERPAPGRTEIFDELLTIAPLPRSEITSFLHNKKIEIPDDPELLKLLSLPFILFLDLDLLKETIGGRGGLSGFIHRFFEKSVFQSTEALKAPVSEDPVSKFFPNLAKFAFEQYSSRNLQFDLSPIEGIATSRVSKDCSPAIEALVRNLKDTALINAPRSIDCPGASDGSPGRDCTRYEFRHQLLHEYLASWHLARNTTEWNDLGFDAITWDAQDTETLQMVVEILPIEEATTFLRRVYDWNYRAMIEAIDRLDLRVASREKVIPDELRDQFAALIAGKLRDPFITTRENARKAIQQLRSNLGEEALKLHQENSSDNEFWNELIALVGRRYEKSGDPDQEKWRKIFSLTELPQYPDGTLLTAKDSLMGWTTANVYRREIIRHKANNAETNTFFISLFPLFQSLFNLPGDQGLEFKNKMDRERVALLPRVALRRMVYLMGVSNDAHVAQILLEVVLSQNIYPRMNHAYNSELLSTHFFQIVREDALRSLLEISARNPGEIRKKVFDSFKESALKEMGATLRRRILNSSQIENTFVQAPEEWNSLIKTLNERVSTINDDEDRTSNGRGSKRSSPQKRQ